MIKDLDLLKHCNYWTYKEAILILTHRDWEKFLEYFENERAACWTIYEGNKVVQNEDPESRILYSDELRDFWNLVNFLNREITTGNIKLYVKDRAKPSNNWKLDRQSFLDWVRKYKEPIFSKRHFPQNQRDILKELLGEKESNDFFSTPDRTKWNEISFTITEEAHFEIKICKEKKDFPPDEIKNLGLKKKSLALLYKIIYLGGVFNKDDFEGSLKKYLKQYVSDLRADLKQLFNMEDDPFKNDKKGLYKTQFSVHSKLSSSLEKKSSSA